MCGLLAPRRPRTSNHTTQGHFVHIRLWQTNTILIIKWRRTSLRYNLSSILRLAAKTIQRHRFRHRFRHRWTISLSSTVYVKQKYYTIMLIIDLSYVNNTDYNVVNKTRLYYRVHLWGDFLEYYSTKWTKLPSARKHPTGYIVAPIHASFQRTGKRKGWEMLFSTWGKQLMAKPAKMCSHVWFQWSQQL